MLHDATLRSRDPRQARILPETKALTVVQQERDLLRLERDLLRREWAVEGLSLESTFAVDRPDALTIPDITEMALLTTITERRGAEDSDAFPALMPYTVVGNPPGVLGAQPHP